MNLEKVYVNTNTYNHDYVFVCLINNLIFEIKINCYHRERNLHVLFIIYLYLIISVQSNKETRKFFRRF